METNVAVPIAAAGRISFTGMALAAGYVRTYELDNLHDWEQGEAVTRCLGAARALLLKYHGIVVVAESIEEATVHVILLEKAAKIEILSR